MGKPFCGWLPVPSRWVFLTLVGLQSSVRPHMMISPSGVHTSADPSSALLLQVLPANLTSGGTMIPPTVPHPGLESFEGTAPRQ